MGLFPNGRGRPWIWPVIGRVGSANKIGRDSAEAWAPGTRFPLPNTCSPACQYACCQSESTQLMSLKVMQSDAKVTSVAAVLPQLLYSRNCCSVHFPSFFSLQTVSASIFQETSGNMDQEFWFSVVTNFFVCQSMRVFKACFGVEPIVCSYVYIKYNYYIAKPVHLMWVLSFLKEYGLLHSLAAKWGVSPNTFSVKVWDLLKVLSMAMNEVSLECCHILDFNLLIS